jgi:aryl-alcohol dehydrogenase-like predicted oxidoreductase
MQVALGTAQFGLAYGIAGRGAPMPEADARATLRLAYEAGIRVLDTAAVYGDSEERLGKLIDGLPFRVVSKIPGLGSAVEPATFVAEAIERSRSRLGDALYGLLFHRAGDLTGDVGVVAWRAAARLGEAAGIKLGVSCYDPGELASIRERFPVSIAQLPGNAFDQRIAAEAKHDSLGRVELHMRSVFLQGLLLMSPEEVARRLPVATERIRAWRNWCAERQLSPLRAALAIAKATPNVDYIVIGVDGPEHLEEIMREWHDVRALAAPELTCVDSRIIDPRQWNVP